MPNQSGKKRQSVQPIRLRSPNALNELRRRMKQAQRDSGLTLGEIGRRMGIENRQPKDVVHKLLTRSSDPTLFMVLRFCRATGVSFDRIVSQELEPLL